MSTFKRTIPLIFMVILISTLDLFAQETNDNIGNDAVKVLIDCNRCELDYIKNEIKFVNYVRDTKEADVHILMSDRDAGNGGDEYSFYFIGQLRFSGKSDTLKFVTMPDDTDENVRRKIVKAIEIGLIPYVSKTRLFDDISVKYKENGNGNHVAKDNWNHWVFRINLSGNYQQESNEYNFMQRMNLSSDKITETWKLEFRLGNRFSSYNNTEFDYKYLNRSYYFRHLAVRSISDHLSLGWKVGAGHSTKYNFELYSRIFPAIEYNLFPYHESSVKQLRFLLSSGYKFHKYTDTTIYNKLEESLLETELEVGYMIRKQWGEINTAFESSVYWHDLSKHKVELNSSVQLRIIKGLSFVFDGRVGLIHDQLSLSKGDLSIEEVLTQQKQQSTDYRYEFSLGFVYTFGSIYNNIVNPRFGD
jgi:hypothetical protein